MSAPAELAAALPRSVGWPAALLVGLGGAVMVTVSLGPMAAELGGLSLPVWAATAAVGALQCVLLAELAGRFPGRAGGTASYATEAFGKRRPLLAAASHWGYWFAWTPGIAVNLILAGRYLGAAVAPGVDPALIALGLGAALYAANALGLRVGLALAGAAALVACVPLAALCAGALVHPELLDAGHLAARPPDGGGWSSRETWAAIAKWSFVAAWAAYGAEMASALVAEMRRPQRAGRALAASGGACLAAFALVPALLLALVGPQRLAADPSLAFLPAAELLFGEGAERVTSLMLAAALVLGAQAFAVASSRTVYQMARDGLAPRRLAATSRSGAPIGSIALDAAVIAALVAIFGTSVVDAVAAANVGYLVVFVLLPAAYLTIRRRAGVAVGGRDLLAGALLVLNLVLLVAGGLAWGPRVWLTGVGAMALVAVPLLLARRERARP